MKFSEKVYYYCGKIPKGKVTTYQEIGRAMKTKAYRAIGTALKNNPNPIKVPCHRVIRNNGEIGGYNGILNSKKKIKLLEKEGVKIKNNKIDLKKYLHNF